MTRSAPDSIVTPSVPLYRRPSLADGARVHALVAACPPLDLNSPYAYLLLCTHFADTCALADLDGTALGFVGGYRKPDDPAVLFVWQIAVSPRARGRGLGLHLLQAVLDGPACRTVEYLETTITPSNTASWKLFRSFARARGAVCRDMPLFARADFGGGDHEEERLLRIGPMQGRSRMR